MFSKSTVSTAIAMIAIGVLVLCLPWVLIAQSGTPAITVWYGNEQTFGTPGNPVPAINILGNVAGFGGPVTVSYTLNGGPPAQLSIGPDTRRLERDGDFNIDIPYKALNPGENRIVITASDFFRVSVMETVSVRYQAGNSWPLPYSTQWSTAATIQEEAQVLDGKWMIESGAVRPVEPGYDRMLVVGEESWTDYEVTAPVKILSIDSSGFDPPSNGCGIGFLMRWPGHSDMPASVAGWQPKTGYLPLGALAWYEWRPVGETYRILGNNLVVLDRDSTGRRLLMNTQYVFKARVESVPGQGSMYMMKVWEEGAPEPSEWDLIGQANPSDPVNGSLVLMAHHVDALIGDVTVVPLSTPEPSSIQSDDFSAPQFNTGLWTFVNPLGDASFTLTGANTPDAWVNINVPGGTNHEPWTAGNRAPRIMQPANNTDFEIEAKFEAGMSQRYQLQGIFVQESDNHYLRFEFNSDGSETRMFVAALVNNVPTAHLNASLGANGTAPLYMRVKRAGNTWFMRRSFDGITWANVASFHHQLAVSGVGFYGGNTGTNPQFLASVDYFFNTASPVVPEDPTGAGAPAISQHPSSVTVPTGQTASFSIVATGTAPLSYQWQKNGSDIGGATSASYTTPATVPGDSGATFRCRVTNLFGNVTSNPATLNVLTPPAITSHPANQTIATGSTATFAVVATGTAPLSYQWQKNGSDIGGATSASYTTGPVTGANDGELYRCRVSNIAGATFSNAAVLTVVADGPRITEGLLALYDFEEGQGETVHDMSGKGTPLDLTIQHPSRTDWEPGYLRVVGKTVIESSVAAKKIVDSVKASNEITIEAWIRPYPGDDDDDDSPRDGNGNLGRIVSCAESQNPGKRNFSLDQAGEGDDESRYETRFKTTETDNQIRPYLKTDEGTVGQHLTHVVYTRAGDGQARIYLNGVVASSGTIPGNTANWSSAYKLSIANEVSLNRSWNGELHFVAIYNQALTAAQVVQNFNAGANPHPAITTHPVDQTVSVGGTATFGVEATGSAPLSYQWQKDGTDIVGASSPSYTTGIVTAADDGAMFRCNVSNSFGMAVSNPARLTVESDEPRVSDGLLVLYDFEEGQGDIVHDISGTGVPLDLTIQHTSRTDWEPGYLKVHGKTVIRSSVAATKIIDSVRATNEITIEAWIRPDECDDDDSFLGGWEDKPDRIVSCADNQDTRKRNFSLDQLVDNHWHGDDESRYETLFRTTQTNKHLKPRLKTGEGTVEQILTHVVYTRDGNGQARMYLNGVEESAGTVPGNTSNWNRAYRLSLANEVSQNRSWLGELHLVAVYKRALTPSEVAANFEAGANSVARPPATTQQAIGSGLPDRFELFQNYPNPFNPATRIQFALPRAGRVTLILHNILGQAVRTIVDQVMDAGLHEAELDAHDLPSGMYFYRLQAAGFSDHRKLILLK